MECGLIGLPNVGKSTLLNALTATSDAQAANYPFCTIEPNKGSVNVPDERLECLAHKAQSKKTVYQQLQFVDIAGLVKGASKGEGLGNQFLSHIRQVDAMIHVVRCFEGEVTHVMERINPVEDIEIIHTELMLSDLESLEKRLSARKKTADTDLIPLMKKAHVALSNGQFASTVDWTNEEKALWPLLNLLTLKPVIYACNVSEEDVVSGNQYVQQVKDYVQDKAPVLVICNQIEAEISVLPPEEQLDFLASVGLRETGLNQVIRTAYQHLGLMTFFTVGPQEARAWTITRGSTAYDAGGKIHTDFQKGFIRAEIIAYDDYMAYETVADIKAAGKMRSEGRDYLMQDADTVLFRFNV
jgi:ribosome-binding ATPase